MARSSSPSYSGSSRSSGNIDPRKLRSLIVPIVESVLYSHIPGHQQGKVLKIGQLPDRTTREEFDSKMRNQIVQELQGLVNEVGPSRVREEWMPTIIDQLIAVRSAAEEATHHILAATEKIETHSALLEEPMRSEFQKLVTHIYETANFQDITGQRIGQIIQTLELVENVLDGVMAIFGDKKALRRYEDFTVRREVMASPGEKLEGPQLHRPQISQGDIDKLFG